MKQRRPRFVEEREFAYRKDEGLLRRPLPTDAGTGRQGETAMATKNRNENPGVRDRARHADVPNKDIDEPWISNYPPLHDWLMQNEARCDWQLRYGKGKQGFMLECWRLPGSMPFIVQVFTQSMGWDVFTPSGDRSVDATLADLKARIFPKVGAQ